MTADAFVNWLRGYLAATKGEVTPDQLAEIKKTLSSVWPPPSPYPWTLNTSGTTTIPLMSEMLCK